MKILRKIAPISIVIGVLIYYWCVWLGIINIPYIKTIYANGMELTTINFQAYIQNLSVGWVNFDVSSINFPTRQFNGDISNNIALVFDWVYMPLNVLLYVTRFIAYVFRGILQVFGLISQPTFIDGVWYEPPEIINVLNWIMQNLMIPYI